MHNHWQPMRPILPCQHSCRRDRAVKRTAEWRGMKADLTWWATQRPEVVVAFIRSTHDLLGGHGIGAAGGHGWGSSARGWADAPWRRSSVAFLQVGVEAAVRRWVRCGETSARTARPCVWQAKSFLNLAATLLLANAGPWPADWRACQRGEPHCRRGSDA